MRIIYQIISLVLGMQISVKADIGGGFHFVHWGGIVISGDVSIGENCTLLHGVTIGYSRDKAPKIGNNVFIGTGAVIIGDIEIGDNVKVGANAVVTKSFGPNMTIGGVPAKVIKTH